MNEPTPSSPSSVVDPIETVTDAWLAFVRDPKHAIGPLRDEIEAMLYRLLYPRTLGGFFDGFFDQIAREATLLALSRFLAGNRRLIAATQSGNRSDINAQLMRAIWLALQAAMWRIRSLAACNTVGKAGNLQACDQLRRTVAELRLGSGAQPS